MPDWLQIIVRTLAAIVILFVLTKVLGKRQISELSMFEYITGISIGNIAAYISLDLDNLWYLGILSLVVWVSVSVGIEYWTLKNKKLRNMVDGRGRVIIREGKLMKQEMKQERLTMDELLERLRTKDVYRVADVEFAVMEASGELNVQLKKQYQPITPDMLGWNVAEEQPAQTIVMDGIVLEDALEHSGKDRPWLEHTLQGYKVELEEVALAQVDDNGQLSVMTNDGRALPEHMTGKPKDRIVQLADQLEEELKRLQRLARNESDRKQYEHAVEQLQQRLRTYPPFKN